MSRILLLHARFLPPRPGRTNVPAGPTSADERTKLLYPDQIDTVSFARSCLPPKKRRSHVNTDRSHQGATPLSQTMAARELGRGDIGILSKSGFVFVR